jgi:hypothetical protein
MKTIKLSWIVALAFGWMMIVNILAVALPLNNRDTGRISDSYPNLFAPDGRTFAIWGVIYILLLGFTAYQLGWLGKVKNKSLVDDLRRLMTVNMISNGAWLFAWHYDLIPLSAIIMVILLLTLISMALKVSRYQLEGKEKWLVAGAVNVYFGWITVATIANITVLLVSLAWRGWGLYDNTWMVIITIVATLIAAGTIWKTKSLAYGLVILWAFWGILRKHLSPIGWDNQYPEVIITVILGIVAVAGTILTVAKNRNN